MPYLVLVEPAPEQRQAFARWCLAQDPPIQTASATGSEVPADLFTAIPDELLYDAHVDGHIFRHVIEGLAPHGDGYAPVAVPVDDGARPEPLTDTEPPKTPQKRTQRRTSTRKGAGQ